MTKIALEFSAIYSYYAEMLQTNGRKEVEKGSRKRRKFIEIKVWLVQKKVKMQRERERLQKKIYE